MLDGHGDHPRQLDPLGSVSRACQGSLRERSRGSALPWGSGDAEPSPSLVELDEARGPAAVREFGGVEERGRAAQSLDRGVHFPADDVESRALREPGHLVAHVGPVPESAAGCFEGCLRPLFVSEGEARRCEVEEGWNLHPSEPYAG